MTRDENVVEAVERHVPVIRNNLLILFSSQQLEAISTRKGKEALRQSALTEVRSVLESQGEPVEVEEIYFTSLVVQ
jgi:flagellar FliL protein